VAKHEPKPLAVTLGHEGLRAFLNAYLQTPGATCRLSAGEMAGEHVLIMQAAGRWRRAFAGRR
jgi:3-dehydroquinate synthase class II